MGRIKSLLIPKDMALASTLARRIFQLRELRNMTARDLAKLTRFPISRIEDIESGLETWLSSTDRQLLSKALTVEPSVLLEVEVRPPAIDQADLQQRCKDLENSILDGSRNLPCPVCGQSLRCSVQEAFDIDDRPILLAKAFCTQCPFVLK